MTDQLRHAHVMAPEVVHAQVRLIAEALDEAGIGSEGLELASLAGEVIRRDVFHELANFGVQFDEGCGWSLRSDGAMSITICLKHDRDMLVVKSLLADWSPTAP